MSRVATASPSAAVRVAGKGRLRPEERTLLTTAGTVFALASAGAAMSAAAADAMFLAELGPSRLGLAVAASSALLAVVLAVVGGLADRLDRRRVLAVLATVSAIVLGGLAAMTVAAPALTAVITMIGGKQLAAATDLAFWVVLAERLDARRSQRLLPIVAATGGIGAALGAVLVIPVASLVGARGVLVCAALLFVCAAIGAMRLPQTRRVGAPVANIAALITRSWRDGARAVRRHPLARQLALVVGAAGVFASLAYFALGVAVAGRGGSTADLAALLGGVRGAAQVATLLVQLALTARVLGKIGTGHALLLAPIVALASGVGLVIAPILAVAIAAQSSARILDAAIETPAEKLAQTLLPVAIRGRVAGFLDGTAKRAGAVLGGLIAAVLAGSAQTFYLVTAAAAGLWMVAAWRTARAMPSLAVEHVAQDRDPDAAVDDRAVEILLREVQGPRPERAAEVLARLHERGRIDATAALVRAATSPNATSAVWRALIGVLDAPASVHGPALEAAFLAMTTTNAIPRELAIRALGLAGGGSEKVLTDIRAGTQRALGLTAKVAELRIADDHAGLLALLAESVRETGTAARVAIDELCVEIARALSPGTDGSERALEAARHLARALRRRRGTTASRQTGYLVLARVVAWSRERRDAELSLLRADLLELVRERVESAATPVAPDSALSSLVYPSPAISDEAPENAAALRLYGELLEGADAVEPEDLRRVARALGEPDDEVRAAAEAALVRLGPAAAGELIATAAWGRRRARDRAAALLADLPVTEGALDRLIDAELDALDQTHIAIAALLQPGDELLARRLDERLREIAHTVLLLVSARRRSRAIAQAAIAWRHARGGLERARTLAVVEASLPRALVSRLVEAVDDLTPADRAAQLAAAGFTAPTRDDVIRDELAGRDRLSRGLVLHVLGAAGRSAHRNQIASAAAAEVLATSPTELLRRVTEALHEPVTTETTEGESDMHSRVETLIALGRVPLLASLSTRQLADVAERARWSQLRAGEVVVTSGDALDALMVVEDGALACGKLTFGKGDVVDELACFAPAPLAADLKAIRPTRLIRVERVDFEQLVDDVPGLAAAVCRGLGERARRATDESYKSPLLSRV